MTAIRYCFYAVVFGVTVDWNYFALENICESGRKLGWENFCENSSQL